MGAFTPVKKHARRFNYTPRYYDPVKEALEQRRSELYGRRSDAPDGESPEHKPGDYIRNKRAARTMGRGDGESAKRKSLIISIIFMVMVVIVGWMLSQRFVDVFFMATTPHESVQPSAEYEEFDPYAPITIVPNDYDPSQDVAN